MTRALVLAAAFLLTAAAPALANSPELQAARIPAAACQVGTDAAITTAKAKLGDVGWVLRVNGKAGLMCGLPVANGVLDSFSVAYLDPDGRLGNASVKVFVAQLTLLPAGAGQVDYVCVPGGFRSNIDGPQAVGWTTATVTCTAPVVVSPAARIVFYVELWRRNSTSTSFAPSLAGIDFP